MYNISGAVLMSLMILILKNNDDTATVSSHTSSITGLYELFRHLTGLHAATPHPIPAAIKGAYKKRQAERTIETLGALYNNCLVCL